MSIRVVVADDQPVVRAGLAMLLSAETDIDVVAEAANGQEAISQARRHRPDVVVMDVRMPVLDGVGATRILTADGPDDDWSPKVLILTTFSEDEAVYGALRAGASGFLLKHAAPHDLTAAIRHVAAGESWLDPSVAATVISALSMASSPGSAAGVVTRLTAREREILALMAEGLNNQEIAARLVLSEATVRTHVSRVIMKTGSRDRTQAVVLAYQSGLVVPGRPRRGGR
jgi:DNA-binding NarL/FixJ family response regulator